MHEELKKEPKEPSGHQPRKVHLVSKELQKSLLKTHQRFTIYISKTGEYHKASSRILKLGNFLSEFIGPVAKEEVSAIDALRGLVGKTRNIMLPTPERLGRIVGFLLPRPVRERCFEPYFEELKLDRIEKRKVAQSKFEKGIVEAMLYLRLVVTYLFSLLCWGSDMLSKLSPVLKWFFGK